MLLANLALAVTLAECLGEDKNDMYRFPSTVDVRSVAPKGCLGTGDPVCGQIKPFHGELECVDSAHDCFTLLNHYASTPEDYYSPTANQLRHRCVTQSLYCVRCGTHDNGMSCQDSVVLEYLSSQGLLE